MHDEIEIKLKLENERHYTLLYNRLGPPLRIAEQTNYFFDSTDRALLKTGWAFRLRRENASCLMTLKGPRRSENCCPSIRAEYETPINCGLLEKALTDGLHLAACPNPVGPQLESLNINGHLTEVLHFRNKRITLNFGEFGRNRPVELDKTQLPDSSVNFELEMELERPDDYPAAFDALKRLFDELEIPVRVMNESKFARALKSLNLGHLYRET